MTPEEARALLLDAVDNLGERVAILHEALEADPNVSAIASLGDAYGRVIEADVRLIEAREEYSW